MPSRDVPEAVARQFRANAKLAGLTLAQYLDVLMTISTLFSSSANSCLLPEKEPATK